MSYYTRVFCSSKSKPRVNEIIESINSKGFKVKINISNDNFDDIDWTNFELYYDSNRLPLLIELNEKGDSDGLAKEEIAEFIEFVGKPSFFELNKKKVINHLNNTEYIVCIQIPTSDIVDEGFDVNGELMSFFERNFSGMTQADKEGFYINNKLILKIE